VVCRFDVGAKIALGHPLGCTGTKLTVSLLNELKRRGGKYGIVSPELEIIHATTITLGQNMIYTGVYATENFGTSWVYGARVGYHLTEDFFVQGVYAQTKVTDEAFRQILPGGVFESKTQKLNYYNLSVGYNILPGEVFLFSNRARPSQLFIIGGVGSTKFVDQNKPTFNFGFGFRVFLTDYASLQLDLRDHIFSLDLLGKSQSTQNLELTTGLSFYF